jgi:prefoldin subunit 5
MAKKKPKLPARTNTEVRAIMLQYFYDRNAFATSARGKKGFAIKITDIRKELKASHGLAQQEVVGNLNYLLSQGWIEEDKVEKSVPLKTGTVIPQSTSYYKITAAGIDKIEGPGEFTMDKFKGIRIEATGRNIITVGDGNQVNASFEDAAAALVDLKNAILESDAVSESDKLDAVADIDSIQSQLAKATPNKTVVQSAWETIRNLNALGGLTEKVAAVAGYLAEYL